MDVFEFIQNRGEKEIPNPNYNPKSKKNTASPTIKVPDITPTYDPVVGLAVYDYAKQFSIDAKENEKFAKAGINWNPWENLDKRLEEQQSAMSKIGNSLAQTLVSELALGTAKAVTDVFGFLYQSIFDHNSDYSNPASAYLEQKQEEFRNYAPIYSDPEKNMLNGGLLDIGWYASNAPSIISSLTLLIPGAMVTKGAGLASKALGLSSLTRSAVRGASKTLAKATRNPAIYRNLNKASTIGTANRFLENGLTAATMRSAENYQEARQTYNDVYESNAKAFAEMSDAEYQAVVDKNSKLLEANGIDPTDRNEVAKAFAKASADVTFGIDWFNLGWDMIELYGLKNMWKNIKNAPGGSAAIRREQRLSKRYWNKSDADIEELEKLRPKSQKIKEWFGDHIYGSKLAIAAQLSEGAEEALNYVAQEEGMTFGKALISADNDTTDYSVWKNVANGFDGRIDKYVQAPQLYDSAFWGVLGGVVFQAGGSKFAKIKQKLEKSKEVNENAKDKTPWYRLDELPETKRRIQEIRSRRENFLDYKQKLEKINNGIDIYRSTDKQEVKFADDVEKEAAVARLTDEFIAKMTLSASYNGNLDLLKEWLADDNVRKAMVESGIFAGNNTNKTEAEIDSESKTFIQNALQTIEKVEQMYDDELIAINDATAELDKNNTWGRTTPIEYMQIIATNNVFSRLAIESMEKDIANIDAEINRLVVKNKDKLDLAVDYRNAVRTTVLLNELASLRIARRSLIKDKDRGLTNQLAIADIDKRIEAIESKLTPEQLIFATAQSMRAYTGANGEIQYGGNLELDTEAAIYEDALITGAEDGKSGEVLPFQVLAHLGLSERARTSITKAQVGAYNKFLQDAQKTYTELKGISATLEGLYTRVAAQEYSIDYMKAGIATTSKEVADALADLHNSMDEARKKAIKQAGKSIKKLYFKHADAVRNYIRDKYGISNGNTFKEGDLTDGEIKTLDDALDILDLTKSYNRSLLESLDREFEIYDQLIAAGIDESVLENDTNQNQSQPTQQPSPNNPTQQPTQSPTQQGNSQQGNPATNPNTFVRQQGKVRIKPDIDGGFTIEQNVPDNEAGFNYYTNDNGEIKLEWPSTSSVPANIRTNRVLYDGFNQEADDKGQLDANATTHPILSPDANGKYQVKEKGKLVYKEETTSSTGEGTKPGTAPENVAGSNSENDENHEEPDDGFYRVPQSTQIETDAVGEFLDILKANQDADFDAPAKAIIDRYVAQGLDKSFVEPIIMKAKGTIERFAEARRKRSKSKQSSVTEIIVTQSSITEKTLNTSEANEFKKAVHKLIKHYFKDKKLVVRDGKFYVELESLLRYANNISHDATTATMIYESMKLYLTSDEASKKYVLTDDVIGDEKFLDNVNKSEQERLIEKLNDFSDTHRVDITSIPNELKEDKKDDFYKALDALEPGEKITAHKVGGRVILNDSKGNVVGSLAIPRVNPKTGGLSGTVRGWNYDFNLNGTGGFTSNTQDLFVSWLNETNDAAKELNDIIYELAYTKPTDERKQELLDKFAANEEIIKAKENGYVSNEANDKELINGLVILWRYVNNAKQTSSLVQNIKIESSVNKFFEKEFNSYRNTLVISNNPDGFEITINGVSEGELIRATNVDGDTANYLPADKALAGGVNTNIHKISIGSPTTRGTLIVSGLGNQSFGNVSGYSCIVSIVSKTGNLGYVNADLARLNSDYISKEAKEIINAVRDEIYTRIKDYVEHPSAETFEDIYRFLEQAFTNNKGNSSLFFGINVNFNAKNGIITINTGANDGNYITIYRYNGNHTANSVTVNDSEYQEDAFGKKRKTIKVDQETEIKNALDKLIKKGGFNIKPEFINSDNNKTMSLRGIATRHNGDFVISVGKKTWKYSSFNEFILKNNLVRLNTKPNEKGISNYNKRSSRDLKGNQNVYIKVTPKTSPVRETTPTQQTASNNATPGITKTLREQIIDIINSDTPHKGEAIFKALIGNSPLLTAESLKALQNLDLLPKNIIFDNNFNNRKNYEDVNAEIDTATGQVTIGNKLIDMLTSPIDVEQGVRKLIHEQLHYKLDGHKGYLRNAQAIYDAFKKALTDNIAELKGHDIEQLKQYLFEDLENREEALEEFLVESLTSKELADALNAIPADVKRKGGKRSLFQEFLELMSKIFNWGVTRGSLYEQELYTLRETVAKQRKETKNKKETKPKKENKNPLQTELNFDEDSQEQNTPTETPVEQPEATEQPAQSETPKRETARSRRDRFAGKFKSSVTEIQTNYTDEMQTIKDKAIADGTFMKAPNGNRTNLNERQWLQVRTKSFINWFGDWINNPSEASKVVDKNGEPLVVAHFTNNEFNKFDKSFIGKTDIGDYGKGFYFLGLYDTDELENRYGNKRILCFLNIKNPLNYSGNQGELYGKPIPNNYDGVIVGRFKDEIVVRNPNQIKSATSNTGEFSTTNDDIRRSSVTELASNMSSISALSVRLPLAEQPKFDTLVRYGAIETSCR